VNATDPGETVEDGVGTLAAIAAVGVDDGEEKGSGEGEEGAVEEEREENAG